MIPVIVPSVTRTCRACKFL